MFAKCSWESVSETMSVPTVCSLSWTSSAPGSGAPPRVRDRCSARRKSGRGSRSRSSTRAGMPIACAQPPDHRRCNLEGGVGKRRLRQIAGSTTRSREERVLGIDLDFQGSYRRRTFHSLAKTCWMRTVDGVSTAARLATTVMPLAAACARRGGPRSDGEAVISTSIHRRRREPDHDRMAPRPTPQRRRLSSCGRLDDRIMQKSFVGSLRQPAGTSRSRSRPPAEGAETRRSATAASISAGVGSLRSVRQVLGTSIGAEPDSRPG